MKKALPISISIIVAVWLVDKGVSYVVRIMYRSYKNPTNRDLANLLDLKYGSAFVINVFCSTILYFVLRKRTSLNNIVRIALCVAIFMANFLFFREFRAWR